MSICGRILLAEDDEALRRFLKAALERAGYEVDAVGDGLEALEAMGAFGYDLLLADIVMPGLDGIELARRASELDPLIKVIFITGFAAMAMERKDSMPQHSGVLSKPFHLKNLVERVAEVLPPEHSLV